MVENRTVGNNHRYSRSMEVFSQVQSLNNCFIIKVICYHCPKLETVTIEFKVLHMFRAVQADNEMFKKPENAKKNTFLDYKLSFLSAFSRFENFLFQLAQA